MLCGVTSSKLKHTGALRRVHIGPQLADTQALLVDMKAFQSTCYCRGCYQRLMAGKMGKCLGHDFVQT